MNSTEEILGDSFVLKEQGKWQNKDFADLLKGFNIWRVTCSTLGQQYGQGTFTQTKRAWVGRSDKQGGKDGGPVLGELIL